VTTAQRLGQIFPLFLLHHLGEELVQLGVRCDRFDAIEHAGHKQQEAYRGPGH